MLFARFTTFILRHRAPVAVALVLVVLAVASGVLRLGADFSVKAFFAQSDPETAYLDQYLDRWGEDDMLFVAIDGGGRSLLTRERLDVLDSLADELEAIDGVAAAVSLSRMPRVQQGLAGTWIPVPLRATFPKQRAEDDPRTQAWRQGIFDDPSLVPSYLSEDGLYGNVLVALEVDSADLAQVRPVVHEVELLVGDHPGLVAAGLSASVGGVPAIRADVLDVIVKDQLVLVPVAAVLMGLLLLVLFRSRHGVLIPGIAAAVPLVMLLGLMGWTGENFGLLNQVLLALVPAIAVADAIHLVSRFHEASRARAPDGVLSEADRDAAIVEAMQFMGVACFLTSFTTIVGFLSLLSTDLPVLRNFGLYAAAGVGLAYFTVLFIVPLTLLFTRSSARKLDAGADGLLGGGLEIVARWTTRSPWSALAVALLLGLGGVVAGFQVTVDTKVTHTFNEDHPTTLANGVVDEHLAGVLALEFDLTGPEGAFKDPAALAALHAGESELLALDPVRATLSPASMVTSTAVLVGGPRSIPENPGVIGRLYKLLSDAQRLQHVLAWPEADRARLIVRSVDVGAIDFLAMGEHAKAILARHLDPVGLSAHLSGSSFVAYRGLSRVTSDLRDSLILAFAVIGVIIATLFRSPRLGLLSLPPNALPLVMGYGALGLFGWTLEPAPAVVFTIAIGVSVDSAIHLIARFVEEREAGASVVDAVASSVHHSGRAIAITAVILIVGFAVNIASSSPANASFGKLGTLIIAAALVSNLVMLPAMLVLGYRRTDG